MFASAETPSRRTTTTEGEPQMSKQGRGLIASITMVLGAAIAALAIVAAPAQAAFGLTGYSTTVLNQDGSVATQAGGHPFGTAATLSFNTTTELGAKLPDGMVRDIIVNLPAGFVGSTTAGPKCSNGDLGRDADPHCQPSSQVGTLEIEKAINFQEPFPQVFPLYNMVAPPGVPASFGANVEGVSVYLNARVRSESDYGVTMEARNINQTLPLVRTTTTIWGVPADPVHDDQRCQRMEVGTEFGPFGKCNSRPGSPQSKPQSAGIPLKPLLTNPSDCTAGPFVTNAKTDSWGEPGAWVTASDTLEEAGAPVGITGCDKVPFEPTMTVTPESRQAGAPTGIEASISIPGGGLENPNGIAQSPLRDAKVTFPEGMAVNTASADGLGSCSEAQFDWHSADPANCPADSKLGTVEITTPLLENTLNGSVYLATQGTNPFRSLIALYISVADPTTGVVLKIPGKVSPDPRTGQLTATFDDAPQLPFSQFDLRLKGGNRAALVTPSACGTYTTQAELAGWANPGSPVSLPSSFTIDQGCGNGAKFTPGFEAGTVNPVGGAYSPFTLRVTRPNGQQNVSTIEAQLPKGLLAKLAGVPLCPDAAAASGNCPAASQVGHVVVGTGAGTNPLYVPQPGKAPTAVYLAGPYRGGPYSLVAKVPAQAGPFDLGTVAVRNALYVDPFTAQVTAKSDALPQILQGIPITYRDVRIEMDRPQFTLNPTSCEAGEIASTIASAGGTQVHPAARFQVAGCGSLDFKPQLKLQLKGSTKRTGHPGLKAVVTFPKKGNYANIARAQVGLPHSEFLDQGNLNKVCKQADLRAGTCPASSIYGRAKAWTPLLDKPLEGPVYLGVGFGYKLPALVADLNGQIRILLVGRVDTTKHKGIRNTFEVVPDAPVSRFVLTMKGGKKYGLLENSENTCRKKQFASARFTGQNGDQLQLRPKIANSCGKHTQRASKGHGRVRSSMR
jgi:hypothetical protein